MTKNKETIIEACINLIPYVGGSIASIYSNHINEKRFERIESFFNDINDRVNTFTEEQQKILSSHQHDENSLVFLIEKTVSHVEHEAREKKRFAYQNFFINILLNETNSTTINLYDFFLDALYTLNDVELSILAELYKVNSLVNIQDIQYDFADIYTILGFVNRLRNYGFIEKYIGGEFHVGAMDNSLTDNVKISDFGKEFVNFCLLK